MKPHRTLKSDLAAIARAASGVGFVLLWLGAVCVASWLTGGGDPAL